MLPQNPTIPSQEKEKKEKCSHKDNRTEHTIVGSTALWLFSLLWGITINLLSFLIA